MITLRALAGVMILALLAGCGGSRSGSRAPTAVERAALVAAQVRHLGLTSTNCVTFDVAISRVDSRFARVGETFHPPFVKGCVPSNGQSLYERTGGGWRDLGDASSPFPCGYRTASARVVRSLFGSCGLR